MVLRWNGTHERALSRGGPEPQSNGFNLSHGPLSSLLWQFQRGSVHIGFSVRNAWEYGRVSTPQATVLRRNGTHEQTLSRGGPEPQSDRFPSRHAPPSGLFLVFSAGPAWVRPHRFSMQNRENAHTARPRHRAHGPGSRTGPALRLRVTEGRHPRRSLGLWDVRGGRERACREGTSRVLWGVSKMATEKTGGLSSLSRGLRDWLRTFGPPTRVEARRTAWFSGTHAASGPPQVAGSTAVCFVSARGGAGVRNGGAYFSFHGPRAPAPRLRHAQQDQSTLNVRGLGPAGHVRAVDGGGA